MNRDIRITRSQASRGWEPVGGDEEEGVIIRFGVDCFACPILKLFLIVCCWHTPMMRFRSLGWWRSRCAVRSDSELADRLAALLHQRESGSHSIGDIWRRHRLSCPSREELGSYLLRALPDEHIQWIRLHLEKIGCRCSSPTLRICGFSQEADNTSASRRQRIFQSSVGRLP